jgi:DNA-binding transcriptional LysR family regulator
MQHDGREAPGPTGDRTARGGFRLAVVPGVNPAKWLRVWDQRLPDVPLELVHVTAAAAQDALRSGDADAALLRLPVDRDVLSAIPLYTETTVVVVPTDHLVAAAADEITASDLSDDVLLVPDDDVLAWADPPGRAGRAEPTDRAVAAPATTADAVELVAAGVGVLVVPQSLARLHHRRDLTHRPVTDAPSSSVGLAWLTDQSSDLVEELIGIVRGRTANSSRGRAAPRPQDADGATAGGRGAGRPTGAAGRAAGRTSGASGGGRGSRDPGGGGASRGSGGSGSPGSRGRAGGGSPGSRGSGGRGGSGRGKGTGRSR